MAYQSKYTGLQIDDILDSVEWKEGKIEDLEQIRAGAQKGATALQSYTEKYTGTVTGIKINGETKSGSGVIDLGTISTDISGKVDKVAGKQLSTEDFTTALKTKLEGLNNYDDTELSEALSTLRGDFDEIVSGDTTTAIKTFNEVIAFLDGLTDTQDLESIIASIEQQIAGKMDKITLATVATSGSYNDLTNKPTIPSAVTESTVSGWGFTKNTGTYSKPSGGIPTSDLDSMTQGVLSDANSDHQLIQDINADIANLYDVKQDNLVSGTNIKTINGASLLGSGDITIEGESLTESDIAAMGFTKNTGTYSKPSGGIPKSDLASAVQTSLGKADTALQSYTEQYKGTITGVSANGTSVATSGVANIPAASTSAYGVTKLSSATNSTSTSLAATASAVKAAYDLANSYKGTVTGVKVNGTTKSPSSGVVDLGTVVTDISGKQDKLVSGTNIKTINGTSLLGSGNIVISGGGGSSSGAYAEVNHGISDTTFTLTPNTFHVWDEVANLTLTLGSETSGVANEFLFQFTSGATATSLTLPDDIKWANDAAPTIAENMIYQVSILKGLASVLEFDNKPKVTTISFKIRNYDCIAEEGMTWEQWVSSEYNTANCSLMGNNVQRMGDIVGTSYTSYVAKTDVITSDFVYTLIPQS